ncbi:hypothetical protein ACFL0L_01970 [Patescibacteria group bacterium]
MIEKIIGISGVIVFLIGSHIAMATYYKPFRYLWSYYSDLGYDKNTKVSRFFNTWTTVYFAIAIIVVWITIGTHLDENILLIQLSGIIGALSTIGIVIYPFNKQNPILHGIFVFLANISTNAAILIVNLELQLITVWIHLGWFALYLSVWAITSRVFIHDLKRARPYHAPVQKVYVLLLMISIVSILITF